MGEYCVCGHSKKVHTPKYWRNKIWEDGCYMQDACYHGLSKNYAAICKCQKFKLDNLKFVEDEAKRRNLI